MITLSRMTEDSKQAEKTYLRRTGGRAWEREKPFSPPGDDTLEDSLSLLHDFSAAMTLLQPSPSDRIVDLGAGSGWCSHLLQRLNRNSIAVDISHEMLRVSRERDARAPITAVVGDFEQLPFLDGSFEKAVCLNALHHVPDIAAAVRELSRILTNEGVAVFSEPGVGHAAMPASIAAMQDFGVLEQEILIEPFLELCRDAGFAEVRVAPIAYVIPEFELSVDEWRAWKRLPRTKRPVRATAKMWRGLLELFGIGKRSLLFEEAFAMRLVRLFQQPVEEHPFFVAAKSKVPCRPRTAYRASIQVADFPAGVRRGDRVTVRVKLTNTGGVTWPASSDPRPGDVRLGIQLLDASARMIARDYARVALGADITPSGSRTIEASFDAPSESGEYTLKFDLVAEGVTWFESTGSNAEVRPFSVVP